MKTQTANIHRRGFLKLMAGGLAWYAGGGSALSASSYQVGVGRTDNPYEATLRAIEACGEWPAHLLSGRTVIIKPNLVAGAPAETGITTDPEVVRALADLALRDGAQKVLIVEGGPYGAPFSTCGYEFFRTYDPEDRVQLVDLNTEQEGLVDVPYRLAYANLWLPEIVSRSDVVFMSAAKLKTHTLASATLSLKNLFGLPLSHRYEATDSKGRFAMHERGVHQVVSDLSSVRPIDFSVVDGIWAMEGNGPIRGVPVRMNTVVAGANPLAVDRVCLWTMGIHQWGVQHLNYASYRGMGPSGVSEIQVLGDSLSPRWFQLPETPPQLGAPWVSPRFFSPRRGKSTRILYWMGNPASLVRLRVVRGSYDPPELSHVRTIQDWTGHAPGVHFASWDGRDDSGDFVPGPAYYAIQIHAKRYDVAGLEAHVLGWAHVDS